MIKSVHSRRAIVVAVAVVALVASSALVAYLVQRERAATQSPVERWARQVEAHPDDVTARLQLGYAHQVAGDMGKALVQYNAVLQREPRNTGALFDRATVLRETDKPKLAEAGYWDVLEIEPDHVGAAVQLGRMYAARGQFRSVLAAVRPVVGVHPEAAELQYLTGLAYENLGHSDWAGARYHLALKASPDMPEAREGLKRLGENE